MDARRAPRRILSFHPADQVSNFLRHLGPSHSLRTGSPCPEQAISGAMPGDDGIGLDENESVGPVGPDPTNDQPEQGIESIQLGPWLFAFVNGKLLSKTGYLQCQAVPRE